MFEFQVGGVSYRAAKLNAFQQLHVSRRLAPIVPKIVPALLHALSGADTESVLEAMDPAAVALATMPEADVDYVFHTTLSLVQRQQQVGINSTFTPVWNASARALQFEDIDLAAMTQIVFQVLKDSLGPFMGGLLDKARAVSPEAA